MAASNITVATDWTGLLADPDLARNFGKLLQIYRDTPPETREQALLSAMREIKQSAGHSSDSKQGSAQPPQPIPVEEASTPPFEPDVFSSAWAGDRRRHPRIKCFVAVEMRVNGGDIPVWGNLLNTSRGGCQVETSARIGAGAKVEIGLWVASGKIWIKGVALNGVVAQTPPTGSVRICLEEMEAGAKENLRNFLKCVQEATRASRNESSYLQLLR
jgi:hypothetical protein